MFPVGFRFPLKEGEASSEAERSPLLRLRDGFMPLPEGGGPSRLLQKGTPMLFFIVHDVPGRVRLRARSGFSLRKAQILADRLDAVGGIEGVRVNPRTGSVLLLYANDEAQAGRVPVAGCGRFGTAFRGCRRVRRKPPRAQPEGRVGGLSSAISLSGRSCRFSSG